MQEREETILFREETHARLRRHAKERGEPVADLIGRVVVEWLTRHAGNEGFQLRAPCEKCGSLAGKLGPRGPHVQATCAQCGKHAYFVSRKELHPDLSA
jgi:hypothetical protein